MLAKIICLFALLFQTYLSQASDNLLKPCIVESNVDNQTAWLLQWEDNFGRNNLNETNDWDVQHESFFCGGNGIKQISCNVNYNVHLISGTLSLWAQKENYLDMSYTAATVTTKSAFSYGRWEFRVALPIGKQIRVSIFSRNDNESYWHEFGQMNVLANTGDPVIFRGVHFANSSSNYKSNDLILNVPLEQMNQFHLYGIEWDENEIQFFLNDNFSKIVNFNKASNGMFAYHNIRLQIGIGGILFAKAMPEHFDQLQWKCPALIVDYVRVFKKIIKKDVNIDQFSKCNNIEKHTDESDIIQNICTQSMNLMKNKNNFFVSKDINWVPIVIIVLLVLFSILLIYLICQVVKVKRRVSKEIKSSRTDGSEYYENVYDDVNLYSGIELKGQPGDKMSYMQLQDGVYSIPGNEYLEIKDDYYPKNTVPTDCKFQRPQNDYKNPNLIGQYETLTQNIKNYDL